MVLTKCPIQNGTELWTPGDEYNKFWRDGSPKLLKTKLTEQFGTPLPRSPDAGFRLLPCHYIMKEGERGPFSPKLCVRIKDNNSSPHDKFYRFLLPFSSKFSDLNFGSYVLYILIPT